MHLALQVQRLAGVHRAHRPLAPLARPVRLGQGVPPRAVDLHDLGAMGEAAAAEGHHLGLPLAPARERVGPLLGPAQVVGLLAPRDDAAVDDAGDDRRQLLRGHGEHRLVQEGEALLHPSALDQVPSLELHGQGEEVRVAEAQRHLGRRRRGGAGGLVVPGHLALDRGRQEQVAALGRVAARALDEPLRAPEPPRGPAHLPADREVHPEEDGAARGAQRVAALRVLAVGPLQAAQEVVEAAQHVGRRRQPLEVLPAERPGPLRALERP